MMILIIALVSTVRGQDPATETPPVTMPPPGGDNNKMPMGPSTMASLASFNRVDYTLALLALGSVVGTSLRAF